jgi:hypothetical protein
MERLMTKVSQSLESLWQTARTLEQGMEATGLDAVEGRRFLLRMVAASVDTYVEYNDVDRPILHHVESPIRKMFADCPDADYLRAAIQMGPGRVYRLRGRIPEGTLYVGILLYGKGGRIGHRLTDADLTLDADGRFEVSISTEAQSGTWLRADGDETAVLVRQYFGGRITQAPIEVEIEFLGEPSPPAPLSADELVSGLGRAERMLQAIFQRTNFAYQMVTSAPENTFMEVPGEQLFPTPDNRYVVAWYRMGESKSMVMRGRLPKARYVSVTLYNAWLESLDYQRHRISLNHEQIATESDGSFVITLAHEDPKARNWLDTAGHGQGYVLVRALLLDGDMPTFELAVP